MEVRLSAWDNCSCWWRTLTLQLCTALAVMQSPVVAAAAQPAPPPRTRWRQRRLFFRRRKATRARQLLCQCCSAAVAVAQRRRRRATQRQHQGHTTYKCRRFMQCSMRCHYEAKWAGVSGSLASSCTRTTLWHGSDGSGRDCFTRNLGGGGGGIAYAILCQHSSSPHCTEHPALLSERCSNHPGWHVT